MSTPSILKFKPNRWVEFHINESYFVGKVLGATNHGDGWFYSISNPAGTTPYFIPESDIDHRIEVE